MLFARVGVRCLSDMSNPFLITLILNAPYDYRSRHWELGEAGQPVRDLRRAGIDLMEEKDGRICVKLDGVDVIKPQSGEVIGAAADGVACWLVDTDYNEVRLFIRHGYFFGANESYEPLKTTLKAVED